ncbi:MAG: hypothetical protein Q7T05_03975 [Dehalococcoidia bacterium]|nr:hypothetical protein [Dehalococcoidia bacterium]
MSTPDTDHDRLTTIVEKLNAMPGLIEAAVAHAVQPLFVEIGRHDERLKTLKTRADVVEKRLWGIASALGLMLIGEFIWMWHSLK